ncbi:MAG: glycine--tRNA ligase subunit beta [Gammaproteobacteria bacterium]
MPNSHHALLEIGTEELPATSLNPLAQALHERITEKFRQQHLQTKRTQIFYTPRRLALYIDTLVAPNATQTRLVRGPFLKNALDASGKPTAALLGFCKRYGITIDDTEQEQTPKGERVLYRMVEERKPVDALLTEIFSHAVQTLTISGRTMRWGDTDYSFLRPVRWLLALMDRQILPVQAFGLTASNQTWGHRSTCREPIQIPSAQQWYDLLVSQGHIEPDYQKRIDRIRLQAQNSLKQIDGAEFHPQPKLLEEVANLTEAPQCLLCQFDPEKLYLPTQVIVSVLQKHQRCFPVTNSQGQLLPYFIAVANLESQKPQSVVLGNERVVRPRLADAEFFFSEDSRKGLDDHLANLEKIQFHEQLGSLADKTNRLQQCIGALSALEPELERNLKTVSRAAELCKLDQASLMVQEFPELEGYMAACYSQLAGESLEVCQSIEQHYLPRSTHGNLPESDQASWLALADRLDSLTGLMLTGIRPASERDPLGLRRMGFALVRLALQLKLSITPDALCQIACSLHNLPCSPTNIEQMSDFIWKRFESWCAISGLRMDCVRATEMTRIPNQSLYARQQRIKALEQIIQKKPGTIRTVAECLKRCQNLLHKAPSDASGPSPSHAPPEQRTELEQLLDQSLKAAHQRIEDQVAVHQFSEALEELAGLAPLLSSFFDQTMIMDPDPAKRSYRLHLISGCLNLSGGIADMGALEID